jgi:tetratricopeptide (TPR) repeat protein
LQPATSPLPGENNNRRGLSWVICLALATGTFALYFPVISFQFVNIDDWAYVTDNAHVKQGFSWKNVIWALHATYAGNWHPLTTVSHMLDCQLWGLRPGPHHFSNVLWHAANTLLLFVAWKRMTGAIWRSALVAALFAWHPLHVESVAWISERKDVLSAFFFLLSILVYAKYVERVRCRLSQLNLKPSPPSDFTMQRSNDSTRQSVGQSARQSAAPRFQFYVSSPYLLALACYALGLMSKPMVVTLPFVLLLLDYWPLQRTKLSGAELKSVVPRLVLEKLPFFILAGASSVVTFLAQKSGGAVVGLQNFPPSARLANAAISYTSYLAKTIWPDSLAVFYPFSGPLPSWAIVAAVVLCAFSASAILLAKKAPFYFVGWFWFFGTLVPVIGIVQVGSQAMADRYTYLPLVGVFVVIAWAFYDLVGRWTPATLRAGVGAAVLAACVALTALQLRHWKNSETLFDHAARVTRGNALAHFHLGYVLEADGKKSDSLTHYAEAIRINPGFIEARGRLAHGLQMQGQLDAAEQEYGTALMRNPMHAQSHYGLAEVLLKKGRMDEAVAHYSTALLADPNFAEAHYQLGILLAGRKQFDPAVTHLREAVRLKPDWLEAVNNLAWMLATAPESKVRDGSEAIRLATKAIGLTEATNRAGAVDTLAAAYAEAGQFGEAVKSAQLAATLAHSSGDTNLAADILRRLEVYRANQPYRDH